MTYLKKKLKNTHSYLKKYKFQVEYIKKYIMESSQIKKQVINHFFFCNNKQTQLV